MKCLILLALVAVACADPVLLNYPYVGAKTYVPPAIPEVAVAAPLRVDYPAYSHVYRTLPYYVAPQAIPAITPEGYLVDTPEVAAAKAHHFTEHVKALART
ncbi:hypothetical protein J6590_000876 [Homalodisca vitripennis]|nr:hypothetical protein J6590_000873 [Homalodisca vitripennis]KAG8328219.1 hypothetical protein J6590_000876 [Homalodisca vitripennis]